jgi:hypothetical protein
MIQTPDTPLGGFERRLLGELRAVVELRGAGQRPAPIIAEPPSRPHWPRRAPRRSVAGVAVLALSACAAVLIGLSGSSPDLAHAFPIFGRPASTISREAFASIVSQQGATLGNARLDVRHARVFSTPWGTGYVVTDTQANLICVAVPGLAGSGWAADCGQASAVKRHGGGGLELYDPIGRVGYVEILPQGATATIRHPGSRPRSLAVPDGVLAIVVHRPTVVTTRISGHASTTVIRPPFRSSRIPVPTRAQVAAPVRLTLAPGPGYTEMTATFRTRYPTHAGDTAYVMEYAPLPGTHPTCRAGESPGDTIDEQTSRDIPAGTLLTLRGGAPDCPGRWRVDVYLAVSRGDVHDPGQAWAQPLNGASEPAAGTGDQIVATKTITIR